MAGLLQNAGLYGQIKMSKVRIYKEKAVCLVWPWAR